MTSTECVQLAKRVNESTKKSPLKVVSPIIKKYSGHRQGKIKKKLKFPRIRHGGRSKQKKQIKPQLKTILPKTNAGDVIILEPELLPCALNLQKRKRKEDEDGANDGSGVEQGSESDGKVVENSSGKESSSKINKSKLVPSNKKKLKCLKNIEASLELLESNGSALKEQREQAFTENYLLRVQQRLIGKDENIYNQFMDLICTFQVNGISVCDLYKKVKSLFSSYSDLSEDFVAFLTPEQAIECGVFMDHLLLTTMNDFLNMIDVYFSKSPHQIKKIHSVLETLASKANVTTEYVMETVLPLLKGNPVLRDYFLQLLPNARPPDNFLTDYEEVEYPELNSDVSDDEDILEMIHLPEVEDPFGGDVCPCKCHQVEDEKFSSRANHCLSCSMKFINGKIFIQHGKLLRPARVVFDDDHDTNYHRDRLAPKLYPKRGRKRHRQSLFKENLSPTKSCNLSSDEFKSDIEEDDRGRLKVSKSPRINRKKSASPKHCDKIIPRCIFNDSKAENSDADDKQGSRKCMDGISMKEDEKPIGGSRGDVLLAQKSEQYDFVTFVKQSKTEVTSPNRPLDLPKIEYSLEEPKELLSMVLLNDSPPKEETKADTTFENPTPVFVDKERSRSPPVISIPETETPLFSDTKPILSILENLEDSKNLPIDLNDLDSKILNMEVVETIGEVSDPQPKSDQPKAKIEEVTNRGKEDIKPESRKTEKSDLPWKIEEDRIILQTLQVEENCEETFVKIGNNIPARSVKDIKKRFDELMNMLYEMKVKTSNG